MKEITYYFLLHLVCFIALILNIGIKKDGYPNGGLGTPTDQRRRNFVAKLWKTCNTNGKISLLLFLSSFVGAIIFLIANGFTIDVPPATQFNLTDLYLGYLITMTVWLVPFISETHVIKITKEDKAITWRLNHLGLVTLFIGFLGFLSTVIALITRKSDLITNYIELIGYIMTFLTASVGILGESRDKQTGQLTGLGKATITFFLIFFFVSVINSEHQESKHELDMKGILGSVSHVNRSLDTLGKFIDTGLLKRTKEMYGHIQTFDSDLDQRGLARSKQIDSFQNLIQPLEKGTYENVTASLVNRLSFKITDDTLKSIGKQVDSVRNKIIIIHDSLVTNARSLNGVRVQLDTANTRHFRIEQETGQLSTNLSTLSIDLAILTKNAKKIDSQILAAAKINHIFDSVTNRALKNMADSIRHIYLQLQKQAEQSPGSRLAADSTTEKKPI